MESRNSCIVKVGGVGVGGMMTLKKMEHLCQTGGHDSMCSLTSATAIFGGASACYRPLPPHLDF